MRVLYYDCFCGISGDMNLGALLDLGVDPDYLKSELKKMNIDEEFELHIKKGMKNGISGIKVDVVLKGHHHDHDHSHNHEHGHAHHHHDHSHDHGHTHHHDHSHDHGHAHHHDHDHSHDHGHTHHHDHDHSHDHGHAHHHDHDHSHDHGHTHHHHHSHDRNYKMIKEMIESSALSESVKEISLKIFYEIGIAEAKVHGKSLDEVHFHEVGAVDSIVDVVGAAICLDALKVGKVISSTVQLGGGFVMCDHGKIPVPAPATSEILNGVPVKMGLVQKETTTPTGAAILKATADCFTDNQEFIIEKTGYGLGTRDLEVPNVLRAYIGTISDIPEKEDGNLLSYEEKTQMGQFIIETNIDDMNGEFYENIEKRLFENGALDVFKTPIIMKKGRPAIKLSVLINNAIREKILKIIFNETTSGGVREYPVMKYMMKKKYSKVQTEFGEIQVKDYYYQDEWIKSKPEYEDCNKAARQHDVTIVDVYEAVRRAEKM